MGWLETVAWIVGIVLGYGLLFAGLLAALAALDREGERHVREGRPPRP